MKWAVIEESGTRKINSQLTQARDSVQKADIKGGDVILGKISVGGKKQHLGYN